MANRDTASEPISELVWQQRFAARATRSGDDLTAILALADSRDMITFSGGFPAPETFPVDEVRELTEELLRTDAALALQYSPTEGLPEARAAIAEMITERQGAAVDPGDVLVTSGGIEALQLLARTFVDPGDRVLLEAPSYLGAIMAFAGFEGHVDGVAMDADGLRLDDLERALQQEPAAKLLYVIPDHQNPTGLSLTADRRAGLVDLCRRAGVLVVEDVAYRDLSFDGSMAPSLWSLAPDVVVQIGTFSKVFMPGVRLGWAVGPRSVISAMTAAKQNSDQCSGALGQLLMARYVERGYLDRNLPHARALYAERAAAMTSALEKYLPEDVEWTTPRGGFFVWLTAGADVDARALTAPAARLGVAYVPGAPFYPGGRGDNCFRLAFSRAETAQIDEGIRRLGTLLDPNGGR